MIIGERGCMNINDLVSVILPVYNSEKYLRETIDSILQQSYKELEIIIVNDNSTDSSEEIIFEYQKKSTKIKYIKQIKNQGVAVARNTAIEKSTGRFLAFIDSDDIWYSEKLEKQIAMLVENKIGFSFTAIELIDENSCTYKSKRNVKTVVDYKYLLTNTIIATSTVVIDKNVIGSFFMPLMRSGQDYATWLSILRKGFKAYGINESLVKYRVTQHSLSNNKFKSIKQIWYIQKNYENIHFVKRLYNLLAFVIHAVKKRYL